jgi:hypothetical protein
MTLESSQLFLMGNYDHTVGHESVVQFILVRNEILLDTIACTGNPDTSIDILKRL